MRQLSAASHPFKVPLRHSEQQTNMQNCTNLNKWIALVGGAATGCIMMAPSNNRTKAFAAVRAQVQELQRTSRKQGLGIAAKLELDAADLDPYVCSDEATVTLQIPYCDLTMLWEVAVVIQGDDAALPPDLVPLGEQGATQKLDLAFVQDLYENVRVQHLTSLRSWQLDVPGSLTALALDLKQLHKRLHTSKLAASSLARYSISLIHATSAVSGSNESI
jgi:hypothetical protein